MSNFKTKRAASARISKRVVAASTAFVLIGSSAPVAALSTLAPQVALADVLVSETVALDGTVDNTVTAGGLYQSVKVAMNENAYASLASSDTEAVVIVANGDAETEPTTVTAKAKAGYALGEPAIRGANEPFGFMPPELDIPRVISFVGAIESYSVLYAGEEALTRADVDGYAQRPNTTFGDYNRALYYGGATFLSEGGFDIDENAGTITPGDKRGHMANPSEPIEYATSRSVTIEYEPALTDVYGSVLEAGETLDSMDSLFYGDLNKVVPIGVEVTVGSDNKTVTAKVTDPSLQFVNPADAEVDFSTVTDVKSLWRLTSAAATIDPSEDPDQPSILPNGWIDDSADAHKGHWTYWSNGVQAKNTWIYDNGWYFLDADGQMVTGWMWLEDSQDWFYLSEGNYGPRGKMATGWVFSSLYGGWYYLNEENDGRLGAMLRNTVAKDGSYVGPTGRWTMTPQTDDTPLTVTGEWNIATDIPAGALTRNEAAVFAEATDGLAGLGCEPVAVVATQVVGGVNYAYLALGTAATAGAEQGWYLVTIYQPIDGDCEVLSISKLDGIESADLSDFPEPEPVPNDDMAGGWVLNTKVTGMGIPDEGLEVWEATEFMSIVDLKPAALLSTQVVAGMNYRFLALPADGLGTWAYVVDMHKDYLGRTEFIDMAPFDLNAYLTAGGAEEPSDNPVLNANPLYVFDNGIELRKAYVTVLGTTPNLCTVLANPTNEAVEFDYSKFAVELEDGTEIDFAGSVSTLRANWDYFWRAGTAKAGSMKAGDKYFIYYDDELIVEDVAGNTL